MIGVAPSISDIVLTDLPSADPIDLYCHEEMPPEEEEPVEARDAYIVAADCGVCERRVRFLCLASPEDIRTFQQLLFSLSPICLQCADSKLSHGG
ncbi:oncoprotein E7 [Leopardus wiedii papillomavirus type 1]|uniref:Protein E7 n=1 Tax=Leopardus wiedii papillomavirus type 1 TaxID=2495531 RepID=A0A3S8V2N9_9PAPI|nr:oncoprotein E7 [Leopardus wiedii papillomavirus type 1]